MASSKSTYVHDNTSIDVSCVHYWLIDSPEGPVSRGICKFCGAEDQFQNYVPYPTWHDEKWKYKQIEGTEIDESYFD